MSTAEDKQRLIRDLDAMDDDGWMVLMRYMADGLVRTDPGLAFDAVCRRALQWCARNDIRDPANVADRLAYTFDAVGLKFAT